MLTDRASTLPNAIIVSMRLPFMPRDRNMPKMNTGSSGMMNAVITFITTRSRSREPLYRVSDFTVVIARPTAKASSRAVSTSKGGVISMAK